MPQRTPEERKEYKRNYYEKNKKKLNEINKKWVKNNTEKNNENLDKWKKANSKKVRIYKWKNRGLIDDYDMVFERYQMAIFCDICECVLDQDNKSKKCMDHDHETGLFRNILCMKCNFKIG